MGSCGAVLGREHWEAVALNVIITHPALGSGDAVEVMDSETGVCQYMQPHIQEFVSCVCEEDVVEVREDLLGTR